ncbi:MAG: hypothetical protein WB869_01615 [Candidatus Acidiferrales bacterium]
MLEVTEPEKIIMTLYGQPEGPNFDYLSRNASRMARLVLIPFAVLVLLIIL